MMADRRIKDKSVRDMLRRSFNETESFNRIGLTWIHGSYSLIEGQVTSDRCRLNKYLVIYKLSVVTCHLPNDISSHAIFNDVFY